MTANRLGVQAFNPLEKACAVLRLSTAESAESAAARSYWLRHTVNAMDTTKASMIYWFLCLRIDGSVPVGLPQNLFHFCFLFSTL
jgi:hypothetical protein